MFECWALISGEWIKGWDVGLNKDTKLNAFRPDHDMESVYYVTDAELSYTKYKPVTRLIGEWK